MSREDILYATSFPPEVQAALNQVLPSSDPLDQADFEPVAYINSIFPNEQSLANVDDVMIMLRGRIGDLDEEIREVVRCQTTPNADGRTSLKEAQTALHHLFASVKDIKEKADSSEKRVAEITRDIKQLDHAKRHLTASIKTLHQMQMLIEGADRLRDLTRQREYQGLAQLLQGVITVLDDFRPLMAIPQIAALAGDVASIRRVLADQISAELREGLATGRTPRTNVAHACAVLNHLEPQVRRKLIEWLVSEQLSEYRVLFHLDQEMAWLDHIDKRYQWIKKHLVYFEETLGGVFPPEWEMTERIAVHACELTRKQLADLMALRSSQLDAGLLVNAMTKTSAFEVLLSKRFTGVTLRTTGEDKRLGSEDTSNEGTIPGLATAGGDSEAGTSPLNNRASFIDRNPFNGLISSCFEPHVHVYMETRARELAQMIDKFAKEAEQMLPPKVDGQPAATLPSCADLFIFFKKCLVQCIQMPAFRGQGLVLLSGTFKKYLREYASRVLQAALPKGGSSAGSARPLLANLQTLVEQSGMTAGTGLAGLGGVVGGVTAGSGSGGPRYTPGEICQVCGVLTTAEYCLETVLQLETKLKEKLSSPTLQDEITFSSELDLFHVVVNQCIQLLVADLEATCEPAFASMLKTNWASLEAVGEQSPFVNAIGSHLSHNMTLLRDALANSRKYLTQFCVKFSSGFMSKYIHHLLRCRPISSAGAEQLLLDTHALRTLLLELPTLGAQTANLRRAPASYTKVVMKGISKAELILKVVLTPLEPADVFVTNLLRLLPETDLTEFQRILEMKNVRRHDQPALIERFKRKAGPQAIVSASTEEKSTGLFSVLNQESGRIMRLEKLLKKKF
ncbi:vacuolar protein sorting-associated protein 53 homolog [Varroa jacobsoni]|uniref:Vacuolar protein sorting-associated protein 53 homolog n=1 Tax=Varroa destructor TaxID=109461 RepID=A0A7M7MDA9_VARDE|nr:vacuolar protein sorting-associated protein 53 homolog isoform X2 [Varroa destructor]XP_022691839.1 vacuolar protein sorting-associated protein 53 homolog [Varroa jacobsoni]